MERQRQDEPRVRQCGHRRGMRRVSKRVPVGGGVGGLEGEVGRKVLNREDINNQDQNEDKHLRHKQCMRSIDHIPTTIIIMKLHCTPHQKPKLNHKRLS